MLSVLIVDDERYIREGLRNLLEWENIGFSICDEAGNGQEALEKIDMYQPDLVLLDIKMPGMNGTEVIQRIREKNKLCEIIVLSGYSDFKYAQTAMHYGVTEYIVKPIDENELTAAVLKAKEKISQMHDREESMNQYLKKAKKMVLNDILTGKEFDPYLNYRDMKLDAPLYQVVIYENNIPQMQLNSMGELLSLGEPADQYMDETKIQNRNVILLKHAFALDRFQRWLAHYDRGYQQGSFMSMIFFVYGEPVSDIRNVSKSYHQCLRLLERKFFYDEKQRVLAYGDLPEEESQMEVDSDVSRSYGEKLTGYVQTHNRKKLEELLSELKEYLFRHNFPVLSVRHFLIDLFLETKHAIIRSYGSSIEIPFQKNAAIIELMEKKKYLYEILDYIKEQCEMMMSYVGSETADNVFDEVLYYIRQNSAAQLRLENLSEIFGYSSSYLGKLFLQKCSCSFKAYLDQVRIEKAKELLVRTNLKIYEISAKVGYKYVDVFHQKFRKYQQMSPAEYRKQMTGREADDI